MSCNSTDGFQNDLEGCRKLFANNDNSEPMQQTFLHADTEEIIIGIYCTLIIQNILTIHVHVDLYIDGFQSTQDRDKKPTFQHKGRPTGNPVPGWWQYKRVASNTMADNIISIERRRKSIL